MADSKPDNTIKTQSAVPNAVDSDKAFEVYVNDEGVKAQKMGKPHDPKPLSEVHEVAVRTDRVIIDVDDPLAVQVPPKEDKDGHTPIARAFVDAETPEDKLVKDAKKDK